VEEEKGAKILYSDALKNSHQNSYT
jgi:hypothetical protein